MTTVAYPFDPTGSAVTNKITNEIQVLSFDSTQAYHLVIPSAAPFFAESLVLIHIPTSRVLVEGVDYMLTHRFHSATLSTGRPVYGSITMLDRTLAGPTRMDYQTVGGDWTLDDQRILHILSNILNNPRIVTWEQIADLPYAFPPTVHDHNLLDMVGMTEVVAKMQEIVEAIMASSDSGLPDHLNNFSNPHQVNKSQVGLSAVENYPVATVTQAQAGTSNAVYMTALRSKQLIDATIGQQFTAFIARTDNPHAVTKTQIGLGSVQNYPLATQLQAQEGTHQASYMTPFLTHAAIDARLGTSQSHIQDRNNPHQVTKAQVGLDVVENYPVATTVIARAGVSNVHYMTPAATRETINAFVTDSIDSHVGRTDNPHGVTKAQIGLSNIQNYPEATAQDIQDGAVGRYVTAQNLFTAWNALMVPYQEHLNASDNPHAVTKAQVGLGAVENYGIATSEAMEVGTATMLYVTPALVKHAIDFHVNIAPLQQALDSHATHYDNPHQTTAAQVGAYSRVESDQLLLQKLDTDATAYDSNRLGGLSLPEVLVEAYPRHVFPAVTPYEEDQGGSPIVRNAGVTYTTLFTLSAADAEALESLGSVIAVISGGRGLGRADEGSVQITFVPGVIPTVKVEALSDDHSDLNFIAIGGQDTCSLVIENPVRRSPVMMDVLSAPVSGLVVNEEAMAYETRPTVNTGVTYDQRRARTLRRLGAAGDLPFHCLPFANVDSGHGALVEYFTVLEASDPEHSSQSAEAYQAKLSDVIREMIPQNLWDDGSLDRYYADYALAEYDSTADLVRMNNHGIDSHMLLSRRRQTHYTFEVELGGETVESGRAIGVVAAHTVLKGRPYTLVVMRSPGELAVTSEYPNFSIVLNPFQSDSRLLYGTNSAGGLRWGDGVVAENRNFITDPYDATTTGSWSAAGRVRIRVTRAGDILTIETTDWDDSTYVEAATQSFNLASQQGCEPFLQNGGSGWGYYAWREPSPNFKVLTHPDRYVSYIERSTTASGAEQATLHMYTGTSWQTSNLRDINSPHVRAGRLIYSEWTGRLYHWRRDGSLKFLPIEMWTGSPVTLLTP